MEFALHAMDLCAWVHGKWMCTEKGLILTILFPELFSEMPPSWFYSFFNKHTEQPSQMLMSMPHWCTKTRDDFLHNIWFNIWFNIGLNIWLNVGFNIIGCPKKNKTGFLLHISATKYWLLKSFFSPENWDPYAKFEYKTVSVQY